MTHDVFISHSSRDKLAADALCAALEAGGVRCWIAPRDVQPGREYSGQITRAIKGCRIMVLIFSAHSNNSSDVLREVRLAAQAGAHIINFRIEDVGASDDFEYFLGLLHWLDALTPPMERAHATLLASVQKLLELPATAHPANQEAALPAGTAAPGSAETAGSAVSASAGNGSRPVVPDAPERRPVEPQQAPAPVDPYAGYTVHQRRAAAVTIQRSGDACVQKGKHEEALREYDEALRWWPDFVAALSSRGECNLALGRNEEALRDYTTAYGVDFNNAENCFRRGWAYQHVFKMYARAVEDYQVAYRNGFKEEQTLWLLGECYSHLQQYEEASWTYSMLIRKDPNDARAYELRAKVYQAVGNEEAATRDSEAAMRIGRSEIRQAAGNKVTATRDFESAMRNDDPPRSPRECYDQAMIHHDAGQFAAAISDLYQLIRLDPQNGAAHELRGICFYQLQQLRQAIGDFDRMIALDPQNWRGHYLRGCCAVQMQQFASAAADLREAVRLDPEQPDASELLRAVQEKIP